MPDQPDTGDRAEPPRFHLDGINSGAIRFGSMVVGQFSALDGSIVLDLGWCRMAGVNVRCLDDRTRPEKPDNHRGGIAFERTSD